MGERGIEKGPRMTEADGHSWQNNKKHPMLFLFTTLHVHKTWSLQLPSLYVHTTLKADVTKVFQVTLIDREATSATITGLRRGIAIFYQSSFHCDILAMLNPFLMGRTPGIQLLEEKKKGCGAEISAITLFFTKQANFDNWFFFSPSHHISWKLYS